MYFFFHNERIDIQRGSGRSWKWLREKWEKKTIHSHECVIDDQVDTGLEGEREY
jgi:hypothetical protein